MYIKLSIPIRLYSEVKLLAKEKNLTPEKLMESIIYHYMHTPKQISLQEEKTKQRKTKNHNTENSQVEGYMDKINNEI